MLLPRLVSCDVWLTLPSLPPSPSFNQISSGFNPKIKKDPYKGFVYTSFQERATKISHQNVARLANSAGDGNLGLICSKIAGDESRHEKAYQAIFQEILKKDPEGGLKSFYELMSDQVGREGGKQGRREEDTSTFIYGKTWLFTFPPPPPSLPPSLRSPCLP